MSATFFVRHSGESRNPVTLHLASVNSKALGPGVRRNDENLKVVA